MWWKRFLLIIIVSASILNGMVNDPDNRLRTFAGQPLLNFYAGQINFSEHIKLIYDPGIRKLKIAKEEATVITVIPNVDNDYKKIAEEALQLEGFTVTQCSAMDNWHTSKAGKYYLEKMYHKGYRVVIFDGGHHLPTLGLVPDIIIVPQMAGYTVHGYMRDGMKIDRLIALAEELQSPTIIAVMPRWTVVKEKKALERITKEILQQAGYTAKPAQQLKIAAENHISKYNHSLLIYINSTYYQNRNLLLRKIYDLDTGDVKKVYLAFDYSIINKQNASDFKVWLYEELAVDIEIVNEPVYVFNVFWGGKSVLPK